MCVCVQRKYVYKKEVVWRKIASDKLQRHTICLHFIKSGLCIRYDGVTSASSWTAGSGDDNSCSGFGITFFRNYNVNVSIKH